MVEELPSGLFANCESLEAIKIGIKTSSIDISAFEGCISLKTLFLNAIVPPSLVNRTPLQSKTLQRSSENINSLKDVDTETCILYVPMGTISTYRSSSVCGQFKNIVESGTCNITLNS